MSDSCVNTYLNLGFSLEAAKTMCKLDTTPKNAKKSGPTQAKDIPHPKNKNDYGLVPIGDVVSYGMLEGRFGTSTANSDVVAFPDPSPEFSNFAKALGRVPQSKDKDEWMEYAERMSMPASEAFEHWDKMMRQKAESTLDAVFEASGWLGYSVPNINQIRMAHPKSLDVPAMAKDDKEQIDDEDPSQIVRPPASFPFHTDTAAEVYEKSLELISLYPLDNPVQIVKRAIQALGVNMIASLTPEDIKLLEMAVNYAQNGAPSRPKKKGNPGGPFNSTSYFGKRGAP